MDLENLSLVEGLPREAIESKLKEAEINYSILVEDKNTGNRPYFRSCLIYFNPKFIPGQRPKKIDKQQIIDILGFPDHFRDPNYYYYAKYKMLPNFDISELNGKLTFKDGLLIESTSINF
ncbi:MAG: hypothetical protein KKF46_04415 [Nanoarchaeota archaeon]|nr:hypothetical protein [Nanoarchaeota archaeon]MBU1321580.1 hypothetical protein [Nanoarchaeota archaeon]MBU1598375.1 hypothetical protein [Nanoarchaeota archaeon]